MAEMRKAYVGELGHGTLQLLGDHARARLADLVQDCVHLIRRSHANPLRTAGCGVR